MDELYGGIRNVPYNSKAVSNYTATLDEEDKIKDIPRLLEYFEELQKEDPNFYYKYKLDSMSRVEMIFWVDGTARDVYKMYHDCISSDTTYMTNMYNMPCASFIGINRYGQSIQLGCGFVRNEKIANFVWLFEEFLTAMGGLHPLNIITDQDEGMQSAILIVFLYIVHRNCRWHIMQKVQEKVGPLIAKNEQLRRDFNEVIDYSLSIEEFETTWAEMVLKHGVGENTVFLDVYDLRVVFVPCYFKDIFFPFLQTTARSEGFNAVLKRYVNPQDSLLRFFKQYQKLQEKIDVAEDAHEFVGEDKTVRLWSDFSMEAVALATYTLPIYNRFQIELRKITSYNVRVIGDHVFELSPIQGSVFGYGRTYLVEVDYENELYNCQCCKFSKDGILCCHVMKVMAYLGAVKYIPEHYILPRWTLPTPDIVVPPPQPQAIPTGKLSRKDMRMLRYGNICTDFARIAVGAAVSDKAKEVAEKHMRALEKDLAEMKKAASDALKRKKGKTVPSSILDNDMQRSAAMQQDPSLAENKIAMNPPHTTGRGRPSQK